MGYASKSGRARTSSTSPQAHAICDRCGGRYNHSDLNWQMDWAGSTMINKRMLVCNSCNDRPQEQMRTIHLPADPQPILNPRPEMYAAAETDYRSTSGQDTTNALTGILVPGNDKRITEDDAFRVTQATGAPTGSLNNTPGTDASAPGNSDPGLPYGYDAVPKES